MKGLLKATLNKAVAEKVFPGAVVGIVDKANNREVIAAGTITYETDAPLVTKDTIYDVASVTKAIPGSLLLLRLIDQNLLSLTDKVSDYLPDFVGKNKDQVLIKHLLTYTLQLDLPAMSSLKDKGPAEIKKIITGAPLKSVPGTAYCYVNATAFVMSLVIERITGKNSREYAKEYMFTPLNMHRTTFVPKDFTEQEVAPTEVDSWRGRLLHREVHDEGSHVLGDTYHSIMAGLFSTVPDLLTVQNTLLNGGTFKGERFFSEQIVKAMHTDQCPELADMVGLGWQMGAPQVIGEVASSDTFWKSGFTGCLVVTDPIREMGFTFLSNRVHPQRPNNSQAINKVRREIANIIFSDS